MNTSNIAGVTESADDDLPSVMTCANYLKLPPYSTKVRFLSLVHGEFFVFSCTCANYLNWLYAFAFCRK